jgi:hypothetical protein
MNSPNCTNNDIDALEIQIIEIVLYLSTNSHLWPPPVAIFLALRVWEAFGAS